MAAAGDKDKGLPKHRKMVEGAIPAYNSYLQALNCIEDGDYSSAVLLLEKARVDIIEAKYELGLILRYGLGGVTADVQRASLLLKEATTDGCGGVTGEMLFGAPSGGDD